MSDVLLEMKNLKTSFRVDGKFYAAVDGVDITIHKDEVFALVGESGSGKSALALSILSLHNSNYTRIEGEIQYGDKELLGLTENELNKVRGANISMIFQDPLSALNPLMRVGEQIEETLFYHTSMNKLERRARAVELLTEVGMVNPELTYSQLPHELSGGMRQRAMIAIALACKPEFVIADEPTTALDVTIQAQILDLLRDLQKAMKTSVLLITHDLGVVAEMADRVAVMYAGQVVELAPARDLFKNPLHPYTRSLLASIPSMDSWGGRLQAIKGIVPPLHLMPREGCRFSHRTPWMSKSIHEEVPALHEVLPNHFVRCTCHKDFVFEGDTQPAKTEPQPQTSGNGVM